MSVLLNSFSSSLEGVNLSEVQCLYVPAERGIFCQCSLLPVISLHNWNLGLLVGVTYYLFPCCL
jgi:hypothetical protein